MGLDPLLVEVLACPVDKGPLLWFEDENLLYNPRLQKSYAVRDGVPVMLIDESTEVAGMEHERLMAKAAAGQAVETGQVKATGQVEASGEAEGSGQVEATGEAPETGSEERPEAGPRTTAS